MSANNQLLIFEIKGEYCVFMNCCVDNDFPKPKTSKECLFKSKDKLEAIEWANEKCFKEIIEYGFNICC